MELEGLVEWLFAKTFVWREVKTPGLTIENNRDLGA
jgi:hypothetical protein